MANNRKNQKQQQKNLSTNSLTDNVEQNNQTDLHIEQTTPMLADKEAFEEQ